MASALTADLEGANVDAYLDTKDILPGEPWQERLGKLIASADAVVFLISPASVASKVCDWEINEAERLSKRVLPLVVRDVPDESVPGRLRRLNYIFLREIDERAEALAALAGAIRTDIAWIREHTRISELAARWEKGRDDDALLRGDLEAAESWLLDAHPDGPAPTPLQRQFIAASRYAAQRRAETERLQIVRIRRFQRRSAIALLAVALLVAIGLSVAVMQARETSLREARVLTSLAQRAIDEGRYDRAMRTAIHGLPPPGALPFVFPWSRELEVKLAGAAAMSRQLCQIPVFAFDRSSGLSLSGDGRRVALSALTAPGRIAIVDLPSCSRISTIETGTQHTPSFRLNGDGTRIALFLTPPAFATETRDVTTGAIVDVSVKSNTYAEVLERFGLTDKKGRIWLLANLNDMAGLDDRLTILDVERSNLNAPAKLEPSGAIRLNPPDIVVLAVIRPQRDRLLLAWLTENGEEVRAITYRGELLTFNSRNGQETSRTTFVDVSDTRSLRSAQRKDEKLLLTFLEKQGDIETLSDVVFDYGSRRELVRTSGQYSLTHEPAFSSDWTAFARVASDRKTIHIGDLGTGDLTGIIEGQDQEIAKLALSQDGTTLVTLSFDGILRQWRATSKAQTVRLKGLEQGRAGFGMFSRNGKQLIVNMLVDASGPQLRGYSRLWIDLTSGQAIDLAEGHLVGPVHMGQTGDLFATNEFLGRVDKVAGRASVVARFRQPAIGQWIGEGGRVQTATWDSHGDQISVIIADGMTGAEIKRLVGFSSLPVSAAFSPDGRKLLTASAQTVKLWDIESGKSLAEISPSGRLPPFAVITPFSGDGRLVAVPGSEGTIAFLNVASLRQVMLLKYPELSPISLAFDAQGRRMVAPTSNGLQVWDVSTGERVLFLRDHSQSQQGSYSFAQQFSDDGATIFSVWSDRTMRTWELDWPMRLSGAELWDRVCSERLLGAQVFSEADSEDPILAGLAGTNVCARSGPLSVTFWLEKFKSLM